jgi:hypothetical protein
MGEYGEKRDHARHETGIWTRRRTRAGFTAAAILGLSVLAVLAAGAGQGALSQNRGGPSGFALASGTLSWTLNGASSSVTTCASCSLTVSASGGTPNGQAWVEFSLSSTPPSSPTGNGCSPSSNCPPTTFNSNGGLTGTLTLSSPPSTFYAWIYDVHTGSYSNGITIKILQWTLAGGSQYVYICVWCSASVSASGGTPSGSAWVEFSSTTTPPASPSSNGCSPASDCPPTTWSSTGTLSGTLTLHSPPALFYAWIYDVSTGAYSNMIKVITFNFDTLASAYAWFPTQTATGVASNTVTTSPSASSSTGDSDYDGGSNAGGLGTATQVAEMQYYGQTGAWTTSYDTTVTFYWDTVWLAAADGGACALGLATSASSIEIEGNIYDVSSSTWVNNGNVGSYIANYNYNNCGGIPLSGSGNQYYSVSLTACLLSTNYYQMYTNMVVSTTATGALANWAGGSADVATIASISVSTGAIC